MAAMVAGLPAASTAANPAIGHAERSAIAAYGQRVRISGLHAQGMARTWSGGAHGMQARGRSRQQPVPSSAERLANRVLAGT
jgi:hypothetical protein